MFYFGKPDKLFEAVAINITWSRTSAKVLASLLISLSGVNLINVLRSPFLYESLFSSYVLEKKALLYEKNSSKTLMKLTPVLLASSSFKAGIVCDHF